MADVSIKYKGSTIAELDGKGSKTMQTAGTYCEGDITVDYAPRSKTYELTLTKSYGWVLLTTLDTEVVEHINDETLVVTLVNMSPCEYVYYVGTMYIATNKQLGLYSTNPIYGVGNRKQSETVTATNPIYYPANNTDDIDKSIQGFGAFRINGGKYYIRPGDGYISAGSYKLTFSW